MRRFRTTTPAFMFTAALAVIAMQGCEYNSPFQGESTESDREAGMRTFNEETGGVNQDPLIGGGQAGFDQ